MTKPDPELGLERLLAALGQDLLAAPDAEIRDVANELGQKPGMKGSIALLGVTFAWRLKDELNESVQQSKETSRRTGGPRRSRRRQKGDAPSSS